MKKIIVNPRVNKNKTATINGRYYMTAEFLRSINANGMAKFFEFSK